MSEPIGNDFSSFEREKLETEIKEPITKHEITQFFSGKKFRQTVIVSLMDISIFLKEFFILFFLIFLLFFLFQCLTDFFYFILFYF